MRPQQHGRRQRSRGNNNNNNGGGNRRPQNPLARSYESNGPDVKIRGNAQQVADKYDQLARDAQSAGDRVMAENYLQHAEHYKRIIMAAQAQNERDEQEARERAAANNSIDDDSGDDGDNNRQDLRHEQRQDGRDEQRKNAQSNPHASHDAPQPTLDGTPAEVALGEKSGSVDDKAPRTRRPRKPRAENEAAAISDGHSNGSDTNSSDQLALNAESDADTADAAPKKRTRKPRAKPAETEINNEAEALDA